MNTYPLYMSQKMLFLSKESSLKSSVDTVASALSGLSELTEENVDAALSLVEITGVSLQDFNQEQQEVLYQQARYCQAMTEADVDALREMIAEDTVFTHMSGRQQSREEYLVDIENGSLRYFSIGMENPVVEVDGDLASVTFTSVLNANAYGARGTYRISGTHWYEWQDDVWIAVNDPNGGGT